MTKTSCLRKRKLQGTLDNATQGGLDEEQVVSTTHILAKGMHRQSSSSTVVEGHPTDEEQVGKGIHRGPPRQQGASCSETAQSSIGEEKSGRSGKVSEHHLKRRPTKLDE